MVGANFMAFLAARDESPVRMSTYGVPLVRPVVPPLTEPRTHVHVPICTARTTTPQSHIPYRFFHASACRFLYAIAGRRALH